MISQTLFGSWKSFSNKYLFIVEININCNHQITVKISLLGAIV